ncbi:MAG: hypothetical protein JRJ00_01570 [Deltaproteobacteria bacterium]|nr:hypothetical protein [Deltaproteobacteria bacterium]
MNHLKVRCGVLVLSVIVATVLCSSSLAHAKTITQAKYVVLLTAKLGLEKFLLPEEAIKILKSFYVVPRRGWQLDQDVSCELLDEVQVLMIKSILKGRIKDECCDIPPFMDDLSNKYNICPESKEVMYQTEASPPPPIDPVLQGSGSGSGKGSVSE